MKLYPSINFYSIYTLSVSSCRINAIYDRRKKRSVWKQTREFYPTDASEIDRKKNAYIKRRRRRQMNGKVISNYGTEGDYSCLESSNLSIFKITS